MRNDQARLGWSAQRNEQKVLNGESFTIPDSVTVPSLSPDTRQQTIRQTVGGDIFAAFSDLAQTASWESLEWSLRPGATVTVGAIANRKAPVTVQYPDGTPEKIFDIPTANPGAVAGVILAWG